MTISPRTVPVMASVPDSDFLARWVRDRWRIRTLPRCSFWQNGVNLTYVVEDRTQKYILRIYRPGWRTPRQIDFELDQLRYLGGRGIPVSLPVLSRTGAWRAPLRLPEGATFAVLFRFATGEVRNEPPKVAAAEVGALVGRLHTAQEAFGVRPPFAPLDARALVERPMAVLHPYRATFGRHWGWLAGCARRIAAALRRLPRSRPAFGPIHGDIHHGNMHFDAKRGASMLFDFDLTTTGWRIFDLATYLWAGSRGAKELRARAGALLAAYGRTRPLSRAELVAFPDMMAARHLWWMGFQARLARHLTMSLVSAERHDQKLHFLRYWRDGKLRAALRPVLRRRGG